MFRRPTPSVGRARLGATLNFFTNGLILSLLPRLPEIKQTFALGDGAYGLMVAALGTGALCALHLPAVLIARLGALRTAVSAMWLTAVLLMLAGLTPSALLFAAVLFMLGFVDAVTDAAQNTHAVAVQLWCQRTIINSMHAAWSIGATLGGLLGSLAAGLGIPLWLQNFAVAALIAGLAVWCLRLGAIPAGVIPRTADNAPVPGGVSSNVSRRALLTVIPLALLGLCGVLPEDLANNWAGVYLMQVFGVPIGLAGMGLVAMLVSQVIGRLTADRLTDRLGAFRWACCGSVLIVIGSAMIMLAPTAALVYLGFVFNGFGTASLIPTAFAAAGRLSGVAAGTGITAVSFMIRLGGTVSSPILGGFSELFGLRAAPILAILSGVGAALIAWSRAEPRQGTKRSED